ncbi:MAG: methylthioribulose 1-phosphate dehydratase [Planctomycetales bacterium]|nr:methylthioribulose 1-phosphate dehydratase [Planctomycetales bacterium]
MHFPENVLPPHLEPHLGFIDQLRHTGHLFWQRGWSRGTSSNYSVVVNRDPVQLLVTASGKDKGNLLCSDFVLTDSRGESLVSGQPKSSAETLLHCLAAENSEVGAILHTHSIWSTVLSDRFWPQGGIWVEGYEMLKGLSGVGTHEHSEWFPIFENTQDIAALAERVRTTMATVSQPLHGYIIRRHGMYTWGRDLNEAVRHVEIIEFLLECLGRNAMLA